jgi:hypothetical protein
VRRLRCLWLLALALLFAPDAGAATVVILRPSVVSPELEETLYRLKGELLAVGLRVELAERPPGAPPSGPAAREELQKMSLERDLDAIIDVVGEPTATAVDIWVFQTPAGTVEVSRVAVEVNRDNAAKTLAIRAIDVLRSRLVEFDLARRPKPSAPSERLRPRPRETALSVPRAAERLGVEAGAGVLTSLDGVGPAILPLLRLGWAPRSWFAVQGTVAGLGTRPSITTADGSARVSQAYGVLGVCYCARPEPGLHPVLAVAAGASRTSLDGRAEPPREGHEVDQWSFLMEGSVGVRHDFRSRFYLTLGSHVHLALPYVAIHFADTVVASTGRPNLLFTLTMGAWL